MTMTNPQNGGFNMRGICLFIISLLACVVMSETTQYLQVDLGYQKPYFMVYIVNASAVSLFPVHLYWLSRTTERSSRSLLTSLAVAINRHLSGNAVASNRRKSVRLAISRSIPMISALSVGFTVPGILWFTAVSFAPISDVTAIWNTNALWTWVLTVILFRLPLELGPLLAVLTAIFGVFIVVYGDSNLAQIMNQSLTQPTAPLFGDLLTLLGSILTAVYQVSYARYAALPPEYEIALDGDRPLIAENATDQESTYLVKGDDVDASAPLPFAFHANFLSSGIGLFSLLVLWIPIPLLHTFGIEEFSLPPDMRTWLFVISVALSGVLFNGTMMILLGLWGPIVTSVGNLLSIVLVLMADVSFRGASEAITAWSLFGSGVIIGAFGILAYDIHAK